MLRIFVVFVVVASLGLADEPKKPEPKFKLGKDTTYVDGPLDAEGYVDYEAALNKVLKGKTTPETNAVVTLMRAIGPKPYSSAMPADFWKALGIEALPENGEYLIPQSVYFKKELAGEKRKEFQALEDDLMKRPWKSGESPRHADWLLDNTTPLAMATAATLRVEYYNPLIARAQDGTRKSIGKINLSHVQSHRLIAALLKLRAMQSLGENRPGDTLADALTLHKLGRLTARGGTTIELLIGVSIDAVGHDTEAIVFEHGAVSAAHALSYRTMLEKLPPMPSVADKIGLAERLTMLDTVQDGRRYGDIGVERKEAALEKPEAVEAFARTFDCELILRTTNHWYDRFDAAMRKDSRLERMTETAKVQEELNNMKTMPNGAMGTWMKMVQPEKMRTLRSKELAEMYVGLMAPALFKVSESSDRAEQHHRNGILAATLAAYHADKKVYPDNLTDLVPKYIGAVPEDVFTDKPLIYKKTETGYLFYSVGANGKDDGGKLSSDDPRGDDIGVRMPRK